MESLLRSLAETFRQAMPSSMDAVIEDGRSRLNAAMSADPIGSIRIAFEAGIALNALNRQHLSRFSGELMRKVLDEAGEQLHALDRAATSKQ